MRKFLALAAVAMMTATGAMAQKSQPAGMRVEVCDAETDHGEYSIFTYQDTDSVSTFGYYLSLGRTADFLGADEILGIQVQNIHEVTLRLFAHHPRRQDLRLQPTAA